MNLSYLIIFILGLRFKIAFIFTLELIKLREKILFQLIELDLKRVFQII